MKSLEIENGIYVFIIPDEDYIAGYLCKSCGEVGDWAMIQAHVCVDKDALDRAEKEKKDEETVKALIDDHFEKMCNGKDYQTIDFNRKKYQFWSMAYWYSFQLSRIERQFPDAVVEKMVRTELARLAEFCVGRRETLMERYDLMRKQGVAYADRKKAQEADQPQFDLIDKYETKYKLALTNHIIRPFKDWLVPEDFSWIMSVGFTQFLRVNIERAIITINKEPDKYEKSNLINKGYFGAILRERSEAYF